MEHRFESHGLDFVIDGDGFMNARDDFEAICERTEAALDAMASDELSRLYAGALAVTDGLEAIALDDVAGKIKAAVTRGWHNPNGAIVSLFPLPKA